MACRSPCSTRTPCGRCAGDYTGALRPRRCDELLDVASFTRMVGATNLSTAASAVAGPSTSITTEVCNLAPMLVCGNTRSTRSELWISSSTLLSVLKLADGNNPVR